MVVGVIKIEKTMFDKLKELLLKESWTEQDGGEIYFNGEYRTIFYNKGETEVIYIGYDTFPDDELIESIKGKHEAIVTKSCTKCGKVLYKGTESDAKTLIIYCGDCPLDKKSKT